MAYCTRTDIETYYGSSNVSQWADKNGNESAAEITAAITAAIAYADSVIDTTLDGSLYTIPLSFEATSSETVVQEIAVKLAGGWLYTGRGLREFDEIDGEPIHRFSNLVREAKRQLQDIRSGAFRIRAKYQDRGIRTPRVI